MIKGAIERKSSKYVDVPAGTKVFDAPNGSVIKQTTNQKKYDYFGYSGEWWAIELWVQSNRVIAYIKANDKLDRGDWPVTDPVPPDVAALEERILELEGALESIVDTGQAAL